VKRELLLVVRIVIELLRLLLLVMMIVRVSRHGHHHVGRRRRRRHGCHHDRGGGRLLRRRDRGHGHSRGVRVPGRSRRRRHARMRRVIRIVVIVRMRMVVKVELLVLLLVRRREDLVVGNRGRRGVVGHGRESGWKSAWASFLGSWVRGASVATVRRWLFRSLPASFVPAPRSIVFHWAGSGATSRPFVGVEKARESPTVHQIVQAVRHSDVECAPREGVAPGTSPSRP
jgi:hypothetical protein